MFLKDKRSGDMIEVLNSTALIDPCSAQVPGRLHAGEEMGEAQVFAKSALTFPSDEALPRCWLDPHYRH